jgi:putative hydrolase of HD superfamily
VHVKAALPLTLFDGEQLSSLVEVYLEFSHLKQLYRQGWLRRGVPEQRCESVAEHSFGVAVLALFLVDAYFPELDRDRVLRMSLLHDFGEIYVGDLMPSDAVSPKEKHEREADAVSQVLGKLPNGAEYVSLWEEYEAGTTPEVRLVRQVDRLEMALQASIYERQEMVDMSEFYVSAGEALYTPELRAVLDEVEGLRHGRGS